MRGEDGDGRQGIGTTGHSLPNYEKVEYEKIMDMKRLYLIDCQNDFCSKGGALSNKEAINTVKNIVDILSTVHFDEVVCTMDTHYKETYKDSLEGQTVPEHCIKGTWGWKLNEYIVEALNNLPEKVRKTFHSIHKDSYMADPETMRKECESLKEGDEVVVCGFCTDICVINNALLIQRLVNDRNINVDIIEDCCAGSTPEKHQMAIELLK